MNLDFEGVTVDVVVVAVVVVGGGGGVSGSGCDFVVGHSSVFLGQ